MMGQKPDDGAIGVSGRIDDFCSDLMKLGEDLEDKDQGVVRRCLKWILAMWEADLNRRSDASKMLPEGKNARWDNGRTEGWGHESVGPREGRCTCVLSLPHVVLITVVTVAFSSRQR